MVAQWGGFSEVLSWSCRIWWRMYTSAVKLRKNHFSKVNIFCLSVGWSKVSNFPYKVFAEIFDVPKWAMLSEIHYGVCIYSDFLWLTSQELLSSGNHSRQAACSWASSACQKKCVGNSGIRWGSFHWVGNAFKCNSEIKIQRLIFKFHFCSPFRKRSFSGQNPNAFLSFSFSGKKLLKYSVNIFLTIFYRREMQYAYVDT